MLIQKPIFWHVARCDQVKFSWSHCIKMPQNTTMGLEIIFNQLKTQNYFVARCDQVKIQLVTNLRNALQKHEFFIKENCYQINI